MKGAGATMQTIILLLIMLAAVLFYYHLAIGTENVTQNIIFDEADILRVENTFNLLNRSLGMTWYISTAQSIFQAGRESIGCGADDSPADFDIKEGYWYQRNPDSYRTEKMKSVYYDSEKGCIYPTTAERMPEIKYNGEYINPRICYPRLDEDNNDVSAYIQQKIEPFLNIKKEFTEFTANNVKIKIKNIECSDTGIVLNPDNIQSFISQELNLKYGKTSIDAETENKNTIFTEFRKMVSAGQKIVEKLVELSDKLTDDSIVGRGYECSDPSFNPNMRYTYTFQNAEAYKAFIELFLTQEFQNIEQENLDNSKISFTKNIFELKFPNEHERAALKGKDGLLLHYDIEIKITENTADYYYYDAETNEFRAEPFELKLKAEDYLTALDCGEGISFVNWRGTGDIACCGKKLWVCKITDNIPADVPAGQVIPIGQKVNYEYCLANLRCSQSGFLQ